MILLKLPNARWFSIMLSSRLQKSSTHWLFKTGLGSTQMDGLNSKTLYLEILPARWWLQVRQVKVAEGEKWQLGRPIKRAMSGAEVAFSLSSLDSEDAAVTGAVCNSPASQIHCLGFAFAKCTVCYFLLHEWTVGFPETRMVAVVSSVLPRKIFGCILGFLRAS